MADGLQIKGPKERQYLRRLLIENRRNVFAGAIHKVKQKLARTKKGNTAERPNSLTTSHRTAQNPPATPAGSSNAWTTTASSKKPGKNRSPPNRSRSTPSIRKNCSPRSSNPRCTKRNGGSGGTSSTRPGTSVSRLNSRRPTRLQPLLHLRSPDHLLRIVRATILITQFLPRLPDRLVHRLPVHTTCRIPPVPRPIRLQPARSRL